MAESLESMLIRHEGMRLKAYLDTRGVLTIGCGRNLDDVGISEGEAIYLLRNDIERVQVQAATNFSWYSSLSPARQNAVLDMCFNLGVDGFKKFTRMIAAIEAADWDRAASEMQASDWAAQVKGRAVELAAMMRTG